MRLLGGPARVLLAATAALLASGAALAPAAAQRPPEPPRIEVTLASISPWTGIDRPLGYQLSVRNAGSTAVGELQVVTQVGSPLGTRSELQVSAEQPLASTTVDTWAASGTVAPGRARTLQRRQVELPPGLAGGGPGAVLPLVVLVTGTSGGGLASDRTGTFVVHVGGKVDQPLRAAMLVPLTEPPHRGPGGEFADDGLAGLLGPRGPLGAMVDALAAEQAPDLTLAVDALLVEEATAMAGSWRLRDAGTVGPGDPRSQAAARFLRQLRAAAAAHPLSALPYADADLPALVRAGLEADAQVQILRSRDLLEASLGTAPDRSVAWPVPGPIDATTLRLLADTGAAAAVLPPHMVPSDAPLTQSATVDLAGGERLRHALVPDPVLSEALATAPAAEDPVAWAQRVLAGTALTWLELPGSDDPRGVLLAPPRRWRPPPAFFTALASGLGDAPWLRLLPAGELARQVPQGPASGAREVLPPTAEDLRAGLPSSYLDEVTAVRRRLRGFQRAVGQQEARVETYSRNLLVAESSAWREESARERGTRFVRATERGIASVYGKVSVSDTSVLLTSRRGQIPVTVNNASDVRLNVVLRVTSPSPRVIAPGTGEPFSIEPHSAATSMVEVGARVTGTFPLRVEVLTPDQQTRITRADLQLGSRAFSRLAIAITGGAAGFLLLWWRLGKRRREEEAAQDGQQ